MDLVDPLVITQQRPEPVRHPRHTGDAWSTLPFTTSITIRRGNPQYSNCAGGRDPIVFYVGKVGLAYFLSRLALCH